jgi:hypothetical protein
MAIFSVKTEVQWGVLQQSFYQLNQNATMNAEEYYRPT